MAVENAVRSPGLGGSRSKAEFGSDYIVEILRALGIEFAAFNPGPASEAFTTRS